MKLKEKLEILKSTIDWENVYLKMIWDNHPEVQKLFWQETFKLQGTGKTVDFDKILSNIE